MDVLGVDVPKKWRFWGGEIIKVLYRLKKKKVFTFICGGIILFRLKDDAYIKVKKWPRHHFLEGKTYRPKTKLTSLSASETVPIKGTSPLSIRIFPGSATPVGNDFRIWILRQIRNHIKNNFRFISMAGMRLFATVHNLSYPKLMSSFPPVWTLPWTPGSRYVRCCRGPPRWTSPWSRTREPGDKILEVQRGCVIKYIYKSSSRTSRFTSEYQQRFLDDMESQDIV